MPDTKENVLRYLEENKGKFSSGESIAERLGVSRNSVWKAIESLRRDGFQIEAASRRGYFLSGESHKITLAGLSEHLDPSVDSSSVFIFGTLESTNKTAKNKALFDAPHGTVIISAKQTDGTGRRKRAFSSPEGGIYMSIILRPEEFSLGSYSLITPFAAVCVCKAIEKLTDLKPTIKWMNDIYLDTRKICGILTEASTDFDTGDLQYIVVGIGINYNSALSDFPAEVRKTAGSLFEKGSETVSKNRLVAEIINLILASDVCSNVSASDSITNSISDYSLLVTSPENLLAEYKKRLNMLGKAILIHSPGEDYSAKALDVDSNGKLIVELPDGTKKTLSSEDISIRLT